MDFPRDPIPGAVAGAQPKILVRKIGNRFVVGQTDEEVLERYQLCADIVGQLSGYCQRKELENPNWTQTFVIRRATDGLESARVAWGLSQQDAKWVIKEVVAALGWNID